MQIYMYKRKRHNKYQNLTLRAIASLPFYLFYIFFPGWISSSLRSHVTSPQVLPQSEGGGQMGAQDGRRRPRLRYDPG